MSLRGRNKPSNFLSCQPASKYTPSVSFVRTPQDVCVEAHRKHTQTQWTHSSPRHSTLGINQLLNVIKLRETVFNENEGVLCIFRGRRTIYAGETLAGDPASGRRCGPITASKHSSPLHTRKSRFVGLTLILCGTRRTYTVHRIIGSSRSLWRNCAGRSSLVMDLSRRLSVIMHAWDKSTYPVDLQFVLSPKPVARFQ